MQRGSVIDGKYRLEAELGSGGIGTVWSAWQSLVERRVAIKFLNHALDDRMRRRFAIEARALGRLNHPNCVQMYEFGFEAEQRILYLVMEHLDGRTLWDLRGQRQPLADVVEIAKQITTALAYAHHQGVAHRDLKPENVMLVEGIGGEVLVKVLDFGLAVLADAPDERVTRTGEVFGTPAYMSPEQVRGTRDAGPSSDLYSLGVMLYEMIDNRLPFVGDSSFDILAGHVAAPVPPMQRPDVPPELVAIVNKLLEKLPENRFESAYATWQALNAVRVAPEDQSARFVVTDEDLEATLSQLPAQGPTLDLPGVELFDGDDPSQTLLLEARPSASFDDDPEPTADRRGRGVLLAMVVSLVAVGIVVFATRDAPTDAIETPEPVIQPAAAPAASAPAATAVVTNLGEDEEEAVEEPEVEPVKESDEETVEEPVVVEEAAPVTPAPRPKVEREHDARAERRKVRAERRAERRKQVKKAVPKIEHSFDSVDYSEPKKD